MNNIKVFDLKNLDETKALGTKIARAVLPGTVIALIGDLGTGKTTITKSIAEELGITSSLTSPTFTIVQEYEEGKIPLYHFDVYRVNSEEDLFEIGFEEYFHKGGLCLIEWADLVEGLLPENTVYIKLFYGDDENSRHIEISGLDIE